MPNFGATELLLLGLIVVAAVAVALLFARRR